MHIYFSFKKKFSNKKINKNEIKKIGGWGGN
jgi:hypothetical protein